MRLTLHYRQLYAASVIRLEQSQTTNSLYGYLKLIFSLIREDDLTLRRLLYFSATAGQPISAQHLPRCTHTDRLAASADRTARADLPQLTRKYFDSVRKCRHSGPCRFSACRLPRRRRINGMYVNALMQVNFGGYLENKYLSQDHQTHGGNFVKS